MVNFTIDPDNHPEFPSTLETQIFYAHLDLLVNDMNLKTFFSQGWGIKEIQSEEISSLGGKKTPALFIYLDNDTEQAELSETGTVAVAITHFLTFTYGGYTGTRQQLYRRILGYIQGLLHTQNIVNGGLRGESNEQLTDAILQQEALEAATTDNSDVFVMRLTTIHGATIGLTTREAC